MPNDAAIPLPVRRTSELLVYPTDDTTDSGQKHEPACSPGTLPPPPALRRLRLRCRLPLRVPQDSPRLQHNRNRFCAAPPEIPSIKIPVGKIPTVSGPMAGTSANAGQTRCTVLPLLVDMGPTGTVMRARDPESGRACCVGAAKVLPEEVRRLPHVERQVQPLQSQRGSRKQRPAAVPCIAHLRSHTCSLQCLCPTPSCGLSLVVAGISASPPRHT